jgi:Ca2+-binding RTX toxin-like protein
MATIEGTDGNDVLSNTAGDDLIWARAGDDTITTSSGRDFVDGGDDEDTLIISWAGASKDITVLAHSATYAYTGPDYGTSTRRVDFQFIEHLHIMAGSGNDFLEGVAGNSDTINGGAGIDRWDDTFTTVLVAIHLDMALASGGGQTLADGSHISYIESVNLTLTNQNDSFFDFGDYGDVLYAYGGDDAIRVSGGQDFVDGGNGEDTLTIDWATAAMPVTVLAHTATYGYVGSDFGTASRRVDFQFIEHLNVISGSGDDFIEGVADSSDTINGGAGDDRWDDTFAGVLAAVDIDMAQVSSNGGQILSDGSRISNVEAATLTLTGLNDTFTDYRAFDDVIYAFDGDDTMTTHRGRDFFDGGSGDDVLIIDWSSSKTAATIDNTGVTLAYVGTDFGSSNRRIDYQFVEHLNVIGTTKGDYIRGTANMWDIVNGKKGNDTWVDTFSALTTGLDVKMKKVSSSTGQTYSDGTEVKNVEIAQLTLTQGNDRFRDYDKFNDVIYAGDGDDDIGTSKGQDFFDGGAGTDILTVNWGGASQDATFYSSTSTLGFVGADFGTSTRRVDHQFFEHLNLRTGSGDDILEGFSNASDTLNGGDGTDTWRDNFSGETMDLSVDMFLASGSTGQVLAEGTEIRRIEAAELTMGQGNDEFTDFGIFNDVIYAQDGSDSILSNDGRDFFDGGGGEDYLGIAWLNETGNATILANTATYAFVGADFGSATRRVDHQFFEHLVASTGDGDDLIEGFANAHDSIWAGGGVDLWRDSFSTFGGPITIYKADISSGAGQNLADGSLIAGVEEVSLTLTASNDIFRDSGTGRDTVYAGLGNDDISVAGGRDFVDGGGGDDVLRILWQNETEDATIFASTATYGWAGASSGTAATYVDFQFIEWLDVRTGSGADSIQGSSGNDVLNGGAGADTLNGALGDDTMTGGQGGDTFFVDQVGDRVLESKSWSGVDLVNSSIDFLMGTQHIEDLTLTGTGDIRGVGNGLANRITGNSGDNLLDGGKNVDTLVGGSGDDTYHIRSPGDNAVELAGGGMDTVKAFRSVALDAHVERLFIQTTVALNGIGNGLDNTIVGNNAANTLAGREGNDTLRGQGGNDIFVFDRTPGPGNVDHILDFSTAQGDLLQLKGSLFGGLAAGPLNPNAFVLGTVAADASDRIVFNQVTGQLFFDSDGLGGANQVLFATFDGGITLGASDFLIV